MIAETIAGLGAVKTAFEIAKTVKDMDNSVDRNLAVINLQNEILSAQAAQAALVNRIGDLEKDLARFETWESEKKRYELEQLPPGIFAYRVKAGMENGEPPHKICANCYNKNNKSLLHNLGSGNGLTQWKCYSCGFAEHSGHFNPPNVNRSGSWMA
ncbi:hypothetical protein [Rhizobium croatiense]|uniref:hypothetical protein n=1 Tax=Rhizobium croatiense TaxID=2867516 RepID=UPI0023ECF863|nr:hypothetical protein [Rhizobium croatiense]WET75505.1 hypothetical protein PYR68_08490 [Rhizobium croatiense]